MGTRYDGLYGEAPPERGTFFRLRVLGILHVEVYKRVGKSGVCGLWEGPEGLTDELYDFIKSRKRSIFMIGSYLKDSSFTAVKKDAKF